MTIQAPKIDTRTAADVVAQLDELFGKYKEQLKKYPPRWQAFDPTAGVASAMVGIFARYCELIIERLNQVPDKNFLAYLDMLGAMLLPPQPARVPLTFSLSAGSTVDAIVPAGTQVAAAAAEGETAPVVFETESDLTVTAAQLTALFSRQPEQDKYADFSAMTRAPSDYGEPVFLGNRNIDHILYIGHDTLLSYEDLKEVRLDFALSSTAADALDVQWETWDGAEWIASPPASDGTVKKTTDGEKVCFAQSGEVRFTALAPVQRLMVAGVEKSWLRCRLLTPITKAAQQKEGMVRASQLPAINSITAQATVGESELQLEKAFANNAPLDTVKIIAPFGDKPRLGDTLYLAHKVAFAESGSRVTISVALSTPGTGAGNARLQWEFWNGKRWAEVGSGDTAGKVSGQGFGDTTKAFTQDGQISFSLPERAAVATINGAESRWIRAAIIAGNYGDEAQYIARKDAQGNVVSYDYRAATYGPPMIKSVTVDYSLTVTAAPTEVAALAYNDFVYEDSASGSFKPFRPTDDASPTLYLGFTLPPGREAFPNRKISIYAGLDEYKQGEDFIPISPGRSQKAAEPEHNALHTFILTNPTPDTVTFKTEATGTQWETTVNLATVSVEPSQTRELNVTVKVGQDAEAGSSDLGFLSIKQAAGETVESDVAFETFAGSDIPPADRPRIVWEYSTLMGWSNLLVTDRTQDFTRPGIVEFLAPADFAPRAEFGLTQYWLRFIWEGGRYLFDPRLHWMMLNTVMATESVTIRGEIPGSSDGSMSQSFYTTRSPVLRGPQLEVREPEVPSADEQQKIIEQEGEGAISVTSDAGGGLKQVWVRWTQAQDFYASGPRDRHYVLDNLTGEITFGDGLSGMVPPAGSNNIRISYKTGGGSGGNKPAYTITQLKTTVPFVEKATNYAAASGGADGETTGSLLDRAPSVVRHRNRAVTIEDFEDLAKVASPDVARARCVPLFDLAANPDASGEEDQVPGTVSLIIVPRSTDPKPLPGIELIESVQEFIDERRIPVASLVVVGPDYVRVDVEADVAVTSMEKARDVEQAVVEGLTRFLHPLGGGLDGNGWEFGREPHKSDLYALIEAINGVDYVRSLKVTRTQDRTHSVIKTPETDDFGKDGRFLVYSGTHKITLSMEEE